MLSLNGEYLIKLNIEVDSSNTEKENDFFEPNDEFYNTSNNNDKNVNVRNKAKNYIEKYKDVDYIIYESNMKKLQFKDLNHYTADELLIARYEMLARLGDIFNDKPNIQAYFESKSWYKPNENENLELVGKIGENYEMIKYVQFLKQAVDKSL